MDICVRQYDPASKKKMWQKVAASEDVGERVLLQTSTSGRDVLLTRLNGHLCAVDAECPHRGAALAGGRVVDGNIRCPLHGYEFDLRSGKGVGNDLTLETLDITESKELRE